MTSELESSAALMERACESIPGGVSSYARTFERPISFDHGTGSHVYDLDGTEYVDYLTAWGAISLGHCHDKVNQTVSEVLSRQDLYGMGTTDLEVEVAEMIRSRVSGAEQLLFGVTGSEVVARAITLARAVTGRTKIIKFQGCYHGWYDPIAMNHLSDPELVGNRDPFSAGLLPASIEETIVLPYNDLEAVANTLEKHQDEIAAIILEPIAHNMGCVLPKDGFLEGLRDLCTDHGTLLIFDEIITGFRHGMGGVQDLENVIPDLTTLGKGIANGYPMSVLAGRTEYMQQFTTAGGDVAFGGTYNAHASALGAAKATLEYLERENAHETMTDQSQRIAEGIRDHIEELGLTAHVKQYGSTFLTYFADPPIEDYSDVLRADEAAYREYRWEMVDRGILMVPKNVRRNYLTASHTEQDVRKTIDAAGEALRTVTD